MQTMKATKHQRGAVRRETAKPVLILFPNELLAGIDQAVFLLDTDRSKFVRNAVRHQLGQLAPPAAATAK